VDFDVLSGNRRKNDGSCSRDLSYHKAVRLQYIDWRLKSSSHFRENEKRRLLFDFYLAGIHPSVSQEAGGIKFICNPCGSRHLSENRHTIRFTSFNQKKKKNYSAVGSLRVPFDFTSVAF
jgi:hypothetical protein